MPGIYSTTELYPQPLEEDLGVKLGPVHSDYVFSIFFKILRQNLLSCKIAQAVLRLTMLLPQLPIVLALQT